MRVPTAPRGVVVLLLPAVLWGAAGEAQVIVDDRPSIRCGAPHDLPEGPRPAIDYQLVEAPAASTTEIGVLFLFTGHFERSQVVTRTRDWVRTTNELFDAGTSGVRLRTVGVRAAPRSVSRKALSESEFEHFTDFVPVIEEATMVDGTLLHETRVRLGADLVTIVAPSPSGWGYAWIWRNDFSAGQMKKRSYNVVGMARDPSERGLFLEGRALAHEVGHNLGLVHDRETLDNGDGATAAEWEPWLWDPAGFGYLNHDSGFTYTDGSPAPAGTVMAYSGVMLRGFSRSQGDLPLYGYGHIELAAGDSTTNADRALRKTAAAVAAFYEPESSEPPPDDGEKDPPPTVGCGDKNAGESVHCHTTNAGHMFAMQYFHQGEWKFAEIAVRSGDSAVFHFFGPANLEVFVKVLDGCAIDGTVWVYASGLTDLPIHLSVIRHGHTDSGGFSIPDGTVLRPQNGGRLNWCD